MSYVSGAKDIVIMYSTQVNLKLIACTDNDNGGSTNDRKTKFGYTFNLCVGVVSWDSKKKPLVTLSL